ncbi:thioredoxin domain-containing protein 9 [Hydra vulgaris]|uniref:Thioredoxin domain-containing protein 9 n=1 Tax=Hydra vulgaris TaxID=6087 RepID=A0ABM4D399_HYDVU
MNVVEQQVIQAAHVVESVVDAELNRLENLDDDDLKRIRQDRVNAMKKLALRKEEWKQIGHGEYQELKDEKEFFDEQKKSERFVCHFYRESTFRCKIMDKHLDIIARKHIETRFVKIDAEKCLWLAQRLKIKVLPTLACIKDSKTKDYIVGFDDLSGIDDFPTEMLEWRLSLSEMIDYNGDKPSGKPKTQSRILGYPDEKKNVRGNNGESDDDDY